MLNNSFINNLKASLESAQGLEISAERYAGSEVAAELMAIDDMEAMEMATSSMESAIEAEAFMYQEVALESAGLSMEEFYKYNESLSTESLKNMASRGVSNVIILVKKAIAKIVKLVMSVFDFFVLQDGRFKSYSKIIKKMKEKIQKVRISTKEKDQDKEYSIRNLDVAKSIVIGMTSSANILEPEKLSKEKTDEFINGLIDVFKDVKAEKLAGSPKDVQLPNKPTEATKVFEDFELSEIVNTEKVSKLAEAYRNSKESTKEFYKEFMSTIREAIAETHDIKATDVVTVFLPVLNELETATKKDIKSIKELKKASKFMDKLVDKVGKVGEVEFAGIEVTEDTKVAVLQLLGILSEMIFAFRYVVSDFNKLAIHGIQVILADAAKCLSGETRITE